MARHRKLLAHLLDRRRERNFRFDDLRTLLRSLGFAERVTGGSHHIFARDGIPEILNLQPRGTLAKAYQVRQVRDVVLKYGLAGMRERPSDPGRSDES